MFPAWLRLLNAKHSMHVYVEHHDRASPMRSATLLIRKLHAKLNPCFYEVIRINLASMYIRSVSTRDIKQR